ncbi:hypothetical protein L6452_08066 [Arctium lappa]|uniref:Uncharacterized protein n=1 Tax=Arctium lappa TaxID=4217 RepID=A0ACB9DGQ8_ARCLA|nr:hypothetical protein L6452_08066 [Arctium lappa]
MITIITEEEYGSGNWFNVLVGACIYVVMRKANKCLPLTSVCNCVGCDSYELGRMVYRVIDHLDLRLPDFDIVGLFDRVIKEWVRCRSNISKDKVGRMVKQWIFLLQCMIKWYVTTGRRAMRVVVAVIVFVCELNEIERLVDIARVHLPWGNDVSVKNIMKNAPIVIQYMEMKSMCNPTKQIKTLEEVGMDLDSLVVDCLNKGDEKRSIEDYTDFTYNRSQDSTNWANEDLERLNVSPECLSMIYLKYLDEYSNVKTSIERIDNKKRERTSKSDFCMDITDFWCGDSERRKEKIEVAKKQIKKIWRPSMAANESGGICVKEEEIEKGYYNTLLDLHVFNSARSPTSLIG